MSIGERIRKQRDSLGISQTYLAKKVGISKQTLYKYETDIITNIPSNKIEDIGKILNVSPAYLMGWEENIVPKEISTHDCYDKSTKEALKLYIQLNSDDQGEIRGEMKQMLKAEKYFTRKESRHA